MAEEIREEVIVEFIADDSDLQATTKKLVDLGKVDKASADAFAKTNDELSKRAVLMQKAAAAQKTAATDQKKVTLSLEEFNKKVKESAKVFLDGFMEQMQKELKSARAEIDKLKESQGKGKTEAVSYRQEMKNLVATLTTMKLAQQENTAEYQVAKQRLGELRDTIADVGAEAKTTGSDTRVFDGLISAASGVTAAYSVWQGTSALLGEENEDLQQALLKVNATMSVLQGLQSIQNVLQKESAASLLFLNNQRKVEVVQTTLATAAESRNVVVKNLSAIASRALATAAALSNPITLAVVAAVVALTAAYKFFTAEAKEAEEQQVALNLQLQAAADLANDFDDGTKRAGERRVADLKAQGATEKVIRERELKTLYELRVDASNRELAFEAQAAQANDQLRASTNEKEIKRLQEILKTYEGFQERRQELDQQIYIKQIDNQIASDKEAEELRKKREADEKAAREKWLAEERERLEQSLAGLKAEQIFLDKNSQAWAQLQRDIIGVETQLAKLGQTGKKAALAQLEGQKALADFIDSQIVGNESPEILTTERLASEVPKRINILKHLAQAAATITKGTEESEEEVFARRLENLNKFVSDAVEIYNLLGGAISGIFQEEQRNDEIRLENERRRVEEKVSLGQLTVKEAEQQNKKLDNDAKQLQRQQAQRDKVTAIFAAVINTAQAVTRALGAASPPFNYILAAAVGAAGLVQINAIRNRPIPNYFKGKRKGDNYEGPAHVAEHGAELRERDGRLFLETKKRVAWVGKNDVIHTAAKTREMLARAGVQYTGGQMHRQKNILDNGSGSFDAVAVGKEIAKQMPGINLSWDKDGFNVAIQKGLDRINYLDNRRKF